MKKINISLEEFMKLKINFLVEPVIDEEYGDEGFIITSTELPGIKVFGETVDQAVSEFNEAKIAWYEMKEILNEDISLSEESKPKPSGRLTARFPVILHQKIITFAEANKSSVNSALNQLINLGFEKVNYDNVLKQVKALEEVVKKKTVEIKFFDGPDRDIYMPVHRERRSKVVSYEDRDFGEYGVQRRI